MNKPMRLWAVGAGVAVLLGAVCLIWLAARRERTAATRSDWVSGRRESITPRVGAPTVSKTSGTAKAGATWGGVAVGDLSEGLRTILGLAKDGGYRARMEAAHALVGRPGACCHIPRSRG